MTGQTLRGQPAVLYQSHAGGHMLSGPGMTQLVGVKMLEASEAVERVRAPCSSCVRETTHDVLFKIEREGLLRWDDLHDYALLACRGCGMVSLRHVYHIRVGRDAEGRRIFPGQ